MTRRLLLLLLPAMSAMAQTNPADAAKLAPYYPTPNTIVDRMLQLGKLQPGEKMFDLGSGDGRIVIMAARKFKADATGIELDSDLVHRSRLAIQKAGLQSTARIIEGDFLKQDYSKADLITVYLLPGANEKLRPLLKKQLKPGARVIAHDFFFKDWEPEQTVDIEDDGEGRSHTIYVYRIK